MTRKTAALDIKIDFVIDYSLPQKSGATSCCSRRPLHLHAAKLLFSAAKSDGRRDDTSPDMR
jgi:hypothetical protein